MPKRSLARSASAWGSLGLASGYRATPDEGRGERPIVEGIREKVKETLRGPHLANLFALHEPKTSQGLPRLSFGFRDTACQRHYHA